MEKLQVTVEVLQTKNAELTRALDEWVAALKLLAMKAPEDGERLLVQVHAMDKRDSVFHKVSSGENIDDGEAKLNGTILGGVEMATLDMDLELVRKDRQECTQQELHQIRRERNRMHAKRARTRKKAQMEELQGTINEVGGFACGQLNLAMIYCSHLSSCTALPNAHIGFASVGTN